MAGWPLSGFGGYSMRTLRRSVGFVASVAAVLIGWAMSANASPAATARWRVSYVSPNNVSLFVDAVAFSARDVWAAGDVFPPGPVTAQRPILRRWNGKAWGVVALPRKFSHAALFAMAASSPTDVWVFGQWRNAQGLDGHAFALRWTGVWSVVGFWPTYKIVNSAVVSGPKNAWIFGGLGLRHFNGLGWTKFKLSYSLIRASAISANDIWAVGDDNATGKPVLSRWHNGQWVLHALPPIASSPPGPAVNDVLARSDQDVWVVGGTETAHGALRPLALHWHSGAWTTFTVPGPDHLGRVIPDGTGGLWATFAGPFDGYALAHFAGGSWHLVKLPALTGKATTATALALVPKSAIAYAVGSTVFGGLPQTNALILKYSP
jgi:hypothetical protein